VSECGQTPITSETEDEGSVITFVPKKQREDEDLTITESELMRRRRLLDPQLMM
jgi:hypothetical protein